MTDIMVTQTASLTEYVICDKLPVIDLAKPAVYTFGDKMVEVFDCTEDHLKLLKECFDFDQIKSLLTRPDFTMCFDSMCGVQGPYARRIVEQELGAKPGTA